MLQARACAKEGFSVYLWILIRRRIPTTLIRVAWRLLADEYHRRLFDWLVLLNVAPEIGGLLGLVIADEYRRSLFELLDAYSPTNTADAYSSCWTLIHRRIPPTLIPVAGRLFPDEYRIRLCDLLVLLNLEPENGELSQVLDVKSLALYVTSINLVSLERGSIVKYVFSCFQLGKLDLGVTWPWFWRSLIFFQKCTITLYVNVTIMLSYCFFHQFDVKQLN